MNNQKINKRSLAQALMASGEAGLLMLGASTALIAKEQEEKF